MKRKTSRLLIMTMAFSLIGTLFGKTTVLAGNSVEENTTDTSILTKIDDEAVTPEYLGIPGEEHYGTKYYARNIWDMAVVDGKVLLSMGDYGTNTGAVPIYYYTNDSNERYECSYNSSVSTAGLSSEEIKRFYEINGTIYSTATDPLGMGQGSYYKFDSEKNQWIDYYKLPLCVHCYDMVEYDGEVFFAGMVRNNNKDIVSCVQKLSSDKLCSSSSASKVEFYYADGTKLKADYVTYEYNGTTYTSFQSDYWRSYDMFVFKGELYVAHTQSTKYSLTDGAGLYKYDKANNRFVQVYDGKAIKGFMSVTRNLTTSAYKYVNESWVQVPVYYSFEDNSEVVSELIVGQEAVYSEPICGAKISTEDTFVAVCNGIFKSSDVISFEKVSLGSGYENYVTRDAFEKDGKYYFLASQKNGANDFTTAIFETDGNFSEFRRVLYFDTKSFARSFAYNDGYLYVGTGCNGTIDNMGTSDTSPYSGELYRINLNELVKDDNQNEDNKISVTGVSLNTTSLNLTKGETSTLKATITPADATDKSVNWSTSDASVVTVSSTGKITAKGVGQATITVETTDGNKTATCSVKVSRKSTEEPTTEAQTTEESTTETPAIEEPTTEEPTTENPTNDKKEVKNVTVLYRTHVQSFGWQDFVSNGVMSGTSGLAKRLEGIEISVKGNNNVGIQYTTHCQSYGWLPWSANGEMNGTEGEAKRLEAIKIQLTGSDADKYDVYYRVHAQSYGWLGWAKNGEPSGTAGYAKRLEGIQIVVVKKGESINTNMQDITSARSEAYIALAGSSPVVGAANTDALNPVIHGVNTTNVAYKTHVQSYGWQGWKYNGAMSGTSGEAKRLEGINIKLTNKQYEGGIAYTTHVQTYGWQGDVNNSATWKKDGEMSGTSGEAKRLEAICITLTGEMAEHYDVYYRVHAQSFGWLDWAKNGAPAGTAGYAKRLEGIEIVLVPKGGAAPGETANPYVAK